MKKTVEDTQELQTIKRINTDELRLIAREEIALAYNITNEIIIELLKKIYEELCANGQRENIAMHTLSNMVNAAAGSLKQDLKRPNPDKK